MGNSAPKGMRKLYNSTIDYFKENTQQKLLEIIKT